MNRRLFPHFCCIFVLFAAQNGFAFIPLHSVRKPSSSVLFVASKDPTTMATQTNPPNLVSIPPQQSMDDGIFQFNKFLIDTVYNILCFLYPIKGTTRDFARFYVLETVARVPYFAYLSVLHFRETMGERGSHNLMRTHYAQADNEYHHLLVMEHLGGNAQWFDRLAAQTMAFVYYWYVVAVYIWKEPAAYHLSELIEDHAYDTYDNFLKEYASRLKETPVPDIARKYYEREDPFLFDLFCTVKEDSGNLFSSRRPQLETLYDVFTNIRDDEREHWKALCNLVQYNDMNAVLANHVESTKPGNVSVQSD